MGWKNGRMEYTSREMTANEKIAEHLEHLKMLCARGKFTNKILSKSIIDAAYRNCANFPHMPSEVKANLVGYLQCPGRPRHGELLQLRSAGGHLPLSFRSNEKKIDKSRQIQEKGGREDL